MAYLQPLPLTIDDIPSYMLDLYSLGATDRTERVKTRPYAIGSTKNDHNRAVADKTAQEQATQPPPAESARKKTEATLVQCNGCHCLRPVTDFVHGHRLFKSCARCRANSTSYYLEHKDEVKANKYSNSAIFQCGCGSNIKMYCKQQHMRSERHRNWELLPSTREEQS